MLPLLEDFLLNLQANNYSQKTIYNYERDLRVFDNFLADSKVDFEQLDKKTITSYKSYLLSRDRETAILAKRGDKELDSCSVNRMLSALRSYLRYLIDIDSPCPLPPEAIKLTSSP